jgi:hypothetical protein
MGCGHCHYFIISLPLPPNYVWPHPLSTSCDLTSSSDLRTFIRGNAHLHAAEVSAHAQNVWQIALHHNNVMTKIMRLQNFMRAGEEKHKSTEQGPNIITSDTLKCRGSSLSSGVHVQFKYHVTTRDSPLHAIDHARSSQCRNYFGHRFYKCFDWQTLAIELRLRVS